MSSVVYQHLCLTRPSGTDGSGGVCSLLTLIYSEHDPKGLMPWRCEVVAKMFNKF
jgi:hypothetical protein